MTQAHISARSGATRALPVCGRGRPRRNQDIGPTPQTAAKLERDVLLTMLEAGELTAEQEAAGRELYVMWRALQRGMFPQMRVDGTGHTPGRQSARSPFGRMSDFEASVWADRYKPWAASETKTLVVRMPKLSRLDLARRIIEYNTRPACVASVFGVSKAFLVTALQESLETYCVFKRAKKLLT